MIDDTYAHPEALVSTQWVAEHLSDPGLRLIESNEDILLYDTGHIQGAVHIDWRSDLQDQTIRDYIQPEEFAALCVGDSPAPCPTSHPATTPPRPIVSIRKSAPSTIKLWLTVAMDFP